MKGVFIMKKTIKIITTAAIVAIMMMSMTGCGKTDEQTVEPGNDYEDIEQNNEDSSIEIGTDYEDVEPNYEK